MRPSALRIVSIVVVEHDIGEAVALVLITCSGDELQLRDVRRVPKIHPWSEPSDVWVEVVDELVLVEDR